MNEECLVCLVKPPSYPYKCTHRVFKAVCTPCEWEDFRRDQPKAVACPKCFKWLEYKEIIFGEDGYW